MNGLTFKRSYFQLLYIIVNVVELRCSFCEDILSHFESLKNWIGDDGKGFVSEQIDLVSLGNPFNGRGIVAKSSLTNHEIIARIPLSKLINVEHADASILNENDELYYLREADVVSLFLLLELDKGQQSFWYPYLRLLPGNVSHSPLFMSSKQLEIVRASNHAAFLAFERFQKTAESRFKEINIRFRKHQDPIPWTLSQFKTALAIVQSRLFSVQVEKDHIWHKASCLVPLADMFNTAFVTNADCATNKQSTHFECFTTTTVSKGEQLLLPYMNVDPSSNHTDLHLWL
mmetsp:Transcript_982/g.1415  ORF Transcript_982/g.1415 Transcript_982/m.1415 type:complete len:288 (-) Transcript_982:397-1260(-)